MPIPGLLLACTLDGIDHGDVIVALVVVVGLNLARRSIVGGLMLVLGPVSVALAHAREVGAVGPGLGIFVAVVRPLGGDTGLNAILLAHVHAHLVHHPGAQGVPMGASGELEGARG